MHRPFLFLLLTLFTSSLFAQFIQVGPGLDGNGPNDNYGFSVAIDSLGKTIAVGAPLFDDDFGQVRVYTEFQGVWTQLGQDMNGTEIGQQFGFSSALSADGRILALGGLGGNPSTSGGHARVFQFSGGQWNQLGSTIEGETPGDQLGYALDLSENGLRLIAGAVRQGSAGIDAGQVKVFEYSGSEWTIIGNPINGETAGDQFGTSVAISADGNRIAIGSANQDGGGTERGQIRVYDWDGSEWVLVGTAIDGKNDGESFGFSLDLSADGQTVIGAAPLHDHGAGFGSVRAFFFIGLDWVQKGTNMRGNSNSEGFGQAVRISGNGQTIVIGTQSADDVALSSGRVNVFTFDGNQGDWVEQYSPITGKAMFDNLGKSVAVNAAGNRFIAGANLAGGTAGYAKVYQDSIMPVGVSPAFFDHHLRILTQDNHVLIISDIPFQRLEIQVMDLSGKVILHKSGLTDQKQSLTLPEESGMYLIRLTDGMNQFTQKVISY